MLVTAKKGMNTSNATPTRSPRPSDRQSLRSWAATDDETCHDTRAQKPQRAGLLFEHPHSTLPQTTPAVAAQSMVALQRLLAARWRRRPDAEPALKPEPADLLHAGVLTITRYHRQ